LKKKILSVLKYLFFLAIGGVLLWLALRGKDINKSLTEIKNADYTWIAFAIVAMIASHIVRALRWNQLLNTLNIKTRTDTTFHAVMIGYFVNNAVPRLGEITRCGILANHHKVPVNSVIGTVIAERAVDILTMVVILLITIFSQLQFLSNFLQDKVIGPIANKFSIHSSGMFLLLGGVIGVCIVFFILYRLFLPRLRKLKFFHKTLDVVKGFWEGVKTIKNVKHKYLFLFYSILMWLLYTITIYLCFNSISATKDLAFIDALTIMALGSIGTLVPTPGGIGAYQYFVTISLIALFAIEKNTASAFANLIYFSQWLLINILGGLSWGIMIVLQKKINKDENN
jgi:glycosyltransferase 2 family protein